MSRAGLSLGLVGLPSRLRRDFAPRRHVTRRRVRDSIAVVAYLNDPHWNADGHMFVAERLAEYIKDHDLIVADFESSP